MRYMLLIDVEERPQDPAATGAETGPTEMSAAWFEYDNWLVAQGIYRGGAALAPTSAATTVRVRGGERLVTDGPFTETKEVLGGYYLIECADLDVALAAAARCPAAAYGSIEVRPVREMTAPVAASTSPRSN